MTYVTTNWAVFFEKTEAWQAVFESIGVVSKGFKCEGSDARNIGSGKEKGAALAAPRGNCTTCAYLTPFSGSQEP